MKQIVLLTLLIIIAHAKEPNITQYFNVQTIKVKKSSHAKMMTSYGFVKADESLVYDVSPRFGGFVETLYADKIYKKVQMGEALAKVYSPEVFQAKEDYLNTLNYAKANKKMIKSAKKRLELLDIPQKEIDAIAKSKKTSSFSTILSPINGYIFKKALNNKASFNAKERLFEIVNLQRVWVELKIRQNQLAAVKTMKNFTLETPSSSKTFVAKKIEVYPELDEKEESFTLRLQAQNDDLALRPGMYVSAQMSSETKEYLTLPRTAVIRKNGKYFVFASGEYEGEYEPKEVEVEVLDPETYVMKSGVSEDEEVVNNALFMMDSDAQINGLY